MGLLVMSISMRKRTQRASVLDQTIATTVSARRTLKQVLTLD